MHEVARRQRCTRLSQLLRAVLLHAPCEATAGSEAQAQCPWRSIRVSTPATYRLSKEPGVEIPDRTLVRGHLRRLSTDSDDS